MPAASPTFDYEAALAACAGGDRAALHRIYQHESRRLLGVAPTTACDAASKGKKEIVKYQADYIIYKAM